MKKIFILLFFITSINLANAQTTFTATYGFGNVTTSSGTVDPTPTPTVSGLTCGSFVAVGVSANPSGSFAFNFASWTNTASIVPGQYYEVVLTAATGSVVTLNTLTFTAQRSQSSLAPRQWAVRTSQSNYTVNLATATAANATVVASNSFSNSTTTVVAQCTITPSSTITFSNGASVHFRFYAWNAPNSSQTFILDNVTFTGTVSAITNPTPRIYYYTNHGTNFLFNVANNWRVGTSYPFSANNSGTMTTPASVPSVNDSIAFDQDAATTFSTDISGCDLGSGSLSLTAIYTSSNYAGYINGLNLSLLHADTLSMDGTGGMYFDAPSSGTIQVKKGLYINNLTSNSNLISNSATLQLSGTSTQSITGSGFSVTGLKITGTGNKILNAPVTILDNVDVGTATLTTNGNLTLAADVSTTARIAKIVTGGSISGNVTAWTYATGPTTGWALLGCNGLNGATVNNWNTGGSYSGGQQIPMTCTNCVYTQTSVVGNFTSIQDWNEAAPSLTAAYVTTLTTSTALSPGKGFWVYVGDGFTTTNDITYSLSGTAVQGNVTTPITRSVSSPTDVIGWNLVANPYASPISSSSVITANSSILNGAAVYLWDADNNAYTTNPTDIPAGQGFYVEALSASASFSFNEGMKSSNNTSPLLKTSSTNSTDGFVLNISDTYGSHDETQIAINEDATLGYDHLYDAHKLSSTPNYYGNTGIYTQYTSIATLLPDNSGNDICYLNTLPELTDSIVVPVLAKAAVSGSYTIGIKMPNPISNAKKLPTCVMLKDKVTGLYHDLKMSNYIFTMADTTSAPRFELLLCRDKQIDVSVKELNSANSIFITQDENGAVVKTHFAQSTKATISVFNIMGQQLIKDQTVTGTETTTHLNLEAKNQVLIIRVTTDQQCLTKKMVLH